MVQAAINPQTGEFLGLIIPAANLNGSYLTIFGTAEAWTRLTAGEQVDPREAGVVIAPRPLEVVGVETMCPPSGQQQGGN